MQPKVQKESKVKRVTAEDLGLQYSDEDEEEDDDDDDGSSLSKVFVFNGNYFLLVSIPSLPDDDLSDLFAPSAADPLSAPRGYFDHFSHLRFQRPLRLQTIKVSIQHSLLTK